MLTQELLKEYLRYDEGTGKLYWIKSHVNHIKVGQEAGTIFKGKSNTYSYRRTRILGKRYFNHVLVWLYCKGSFPCEMLDHKDGDGLNNRIDNLRECTNTQNQANIGLKKSNKSGYRGVHLMIASGKWRAQISHNYKKMTIGLFDTAEEANEAYIKMAKQIHKEFYKES